MPQFSLSSLKSKRVPVFVTVPLDRVQVGQRVRLKVRIDDEENTDSHSGCTAARTRYERQTERRNQVSLWVACLTGAAAGLASTPHCLGMCGPLAAIACASKTHGGFWRYQLGRTISYAVAGALAGAGGQLWLHHLPIAGRGSYLVLGCRCCVLNQCRTTVGPGEGQRDPFWVPRVKRIAAEMENRPGRSERGGTSWIDLMLSDSRRRSCRAACLARPFC